VVRYERLAQRALEEMMALYPGSMEARAAKALLGDFNNRP